MSDSGYLPHQAVKAVTFWILVLGVVLATGGGVAHSWDLIDGEFAGRLVSTVVIIASGSLVLLLVNYLFGDGGRNLFGHSIERPGIDPAFAERLHKAKIQAEDETRAG